jgi:hypothetical protein
MDIKRSFQVAKIPIVILIILDLIKFGKTFFFYGLAVQGGPFILLIINLLFGGLINLIYLGIFFYVGYSGIKKYQLGISGSALAGFLAALIFGIIGIVIRITATLTIPMYAIINYGEFVNLDVLMVSSLTLVILNLIGGTILAIIGGFIGSRV